MFKKITIFPQKGKLVVKGGTGGFAGLGGVWLIKDSWVLGAPAITPIAGGASRGQVWKADDV